MRDSREFCDVVKREMKNQGLTARTFAQTMGVPLPTLKRWLNGKGVSLEAWMKMLQALDLTLSDVAAVVAAPEARQFQYSVKQEAAFVDVPGLLAFFQQLLRGQTVRQIAETSKLSSRSVAFYLRRLDAIGIIEWKSGWNFRLKVKGEPRWRKGGELANAFRTKVFRELVEQSRADLKIGIYEISKSDAESAHEMLDEVFAFLQKAERRASMNQARTHSYGITCLLKSYSPEFLNVIPNRSQ